MILTTKKLILLSAASSAYRKKGLEFLAASTSGGLIWTALLSLPLITRLHSDTSLNYKRASLATTPLHIMALYLITQPDVSGFSVKNK